MHNLQGTITVAKGANFHRKKICFWDCIHQLLVESSSWTTYYTTQWKQKYKSYLVHGFDKSKISFPAQFDLHCCNLLGHLPTVVDKDVVVDREKWRCDAISKANTDKVVKILHKKLNDDRSQNNSNKQGKYVLQIITVHICPAASPSLLRRTFEALVH